MPVSRVGTIAGVKETAQWMIGQRRIFQPRQGNLPGKDYDPIVKTVDYLRWGNTYIGLIEVAGSTVYDVSRQEVEERIRESDYLAPEITSVLITEVGEGVPPVTRVMIVSSGG